MNTVNILGNLTKDPIVRTTKSGKSVASFTVAVNNTYTAQNGEKKEQTDYINVIVWGGLAVSVSKSLQKGKRVFVQGRYSTRSYDDANGQKKYITEVVAYLVAVPLPAKEEVKGSSQPANWSQFWSTTPQIKQDSIGGWRANGYIGPAEEEIPF